MRRGVILACAALPARVLCAPGGGAPVAPVDPAGARSRGGRA